MISKILFFFMAMVHGEVVELTSNNWDEVVVQSGKNSFVKFFAPWCGHCKKLKPDWDKLGALYEKDSNVVIGDVDCTASGKELCEKYGVQGYPTLKTFWRSSSEDYKGSRDYIALKKFADEMKPMCAPDYLENCSDEQKSKIESFQKLGTTALQAELDKMKTKISEGEKEHEELLKTLQAQFSKSGENLDNLKNKLRPDIDLIEMILAPPTTKDEL